MTAGISSNSGDENKETQLMGLKVFSKSGFFVVSQCDWSVYLYMGPVGWVSIVVLSECYQLYYIVTLTCM